MTQGPGVLIIDDDPDMRHALSSALAVGYSVHLASSGEEGLNRCEQLRPDLVLLDVMLPQMSGIAVLRALKRMSTDIPVIMMTAFAQVHTAVEAIKLGAADFLEKPVDAECLRREVSNIMSHKSRGQSSFRDKIIGQSAPLERVWRVVERFGPTDIPVLLQGETGTGKGLFAQALHHMSKRAQGPFVGIDCGTIPDQLAESELFGYEDGAFTGAGKKKPGRVGFADRGTLFLDEIGVLSLGAQSKLLTLIEQQQFVPLGARDLRPRRLDARFISATNVPLPQAIEEGTFREDLYYRLNGITIELPPLRERGADVELLAQHFVEELRRTHNRPYLEISRDTLDLFREYTWPGNIRELYRVLSAAVVMADDTITPDDLPAHVRRSRSMPVASADSSLQDSAPIPIDLARIKELAGREAQRRVIMELQKRTNASQLELAKMLGIDPKTLRQRLKETDSPKN